MKRFSIWERGTAFIMVLTCCLLPVRAGTQGSWMNSSGYGQATDNVTYSSFSSTSSGGIGYSPSAYASGSGWPVGPKYSYCTSAGYPNYIWSVQAYVGGGASADNPALDARVQVKAAPCAAYKLDSTAELTDAFSGIINVHASATAGAAVWIRGYEFKGEGTPGSLAELIANADLKWDHLMVGPFATDPTCPIKIQFTTERGHENLYFVTDGVAKSAPMTITCPESVVLGCSSPLVYPTQVKGGCGDITLQFTPKAEDLVPGVPTLVTVVATDGNGDTASCQFTATRQSFEFKGFDSPIGGIGGSCNNPLRTVNLGSSVPVKFEARCNGAPLNTGEPTLSIQLMNTAGNTCVEAATVETGTFQPVANEWHYNWDTSGLKKGVYRLTATLQDSEEKVVYIRLK